jgi:SAM-dependent methyltransferase
LTQARCAACGGGRLKQHFQVAGAAGAEGLIPTTDRFGTALSDIVRCLDCGHMQLEQLPSEAELSEAYAGAESTDYLEEEPGQRHTAGVLLDQIEPYVASGRMLDLGCWAGFLLDEARLRGWQTLGIEPSLFASNFARERFGLDVRTTDLFEAELEPRSYDAVVMGDVIEHLPDPGRALDHIASLVAPRAVLHLTLPDAGSLVARSLRSRWWSVIPTHVQYFTRRSLRTLLGRHGWEVVELTTAPKAFTVDYYLGRLGGYSPPVSRALRGIARRTGFDGRMWAPDFHDRMAAVVRRRDA